MMTKIRHRTIWLLLCESGLIYLCGCLAIWLRFGAEAREVFVSQAGWVRLIPLVAFIQASFYLFDLYDFQMIRQRLALTIRVLQALGAAAIVLALFFYTFRGVMLGRGVFLVALLLMLTLMLAWRLLVRWLVGHPRLAERVLILGTEQTAITIAGEVLQRKEGGYDVIGFVGEDPALVGQSLINPSVLGVMDDLESVVANFNPDRIVVAMPDRRGRLPLDLLLKFKVRDEISVEDAGNFYERLTGKISTERLRPGQLVFAESMRWLRFYRRLRRLSDFSLSLIGLVIASPLMVLIAIAIKLESHGPAFYTQERVGWHGDPFRIRKFRSMRVDAEQNGAVWAQQRDPRVTRVGQIIRKLRIDELPQLINILQGDMSLIGPRPERPEFVSQLEKEIPYYSERHLVKPGLTGWAQICYPYGASLEDAREKHQYDLYYIKNQSPLLDLIILIETARVVLFGRLSR